MDEYQKDFSKPMDPDEQDSLRRLTANLPRDESGFSPFLVGLADVLSAEVFLGETLE